jgi:tetratricopeptide (TPR) repeat protein
MKTTSPRAAIIAITMTLFSCYADAQGQFSQAGAQAIINTKEWNRLLAYGQAWARAEPNNATAYYVIARAYGSKYYNIGVGQPAEAAAAYRKVVQLNPQWVEAWNALGITYQELGQWQESVQALERATQLAPQRTTYWDFLCASYMHTHQFQQAGQAADNLARYARTVSDWFQTGTCYYAVAPYYEPTMMYQKAKAAFQKAVQLDPQDGAAWTNLGTTEQALGNTQAAFADYQKGAKLGNKQGVINNENLAKDIQACMIQRNNFMGPGIFPGAAIVTYNQHCAQYTGEIKMIYRP